MPLLFPGLATTGSTENEVLIKSQDSVLLKFIINNDGEEDDDDDDSLALAQKLWNKNHTHVFW